MNVSAKMGSILKKVHRNVWVAVLLLLSAAGVWWGFCVYSAATASSEFSLETREIMRLDERLAPVPAALGSVRVIGYLDGHFADSAARRERRYKMTRYVLAPTLVVNTTDGATILADFESETALDAYLAAHPFKVRRRFGEGLAILGAGER